jgi:hypothetical protein
VEPGQLSYRAKEVSVHTYMHTHTHTHQRAFSELLDLLRHGGAVQHSLPLVREVVEDAADVFLEAEVDQAISLVQHLSGETTVYEVVQ